MTDTELIAARETAAAELARIDAQLAEAKQAARAENIAAVRALMAEQGLTASDLGSPAVKAVKLRAVKTTAAPMYRDPVTGQTASGKGKRPNWLRAELMRGKTLEDFRIAA